MELKNCYEAFGGDYDDVIRRMGSSDRVVKILGIFLRDNTAGELAAALERGDLDAAFMAAHTLKGIALNLGLSELSRTAARLTEELRARKYTDLVPELADGVAEIYGNIHKTIKSFLE